MAIFSILFFLLFCGPVWGGDALQGFCCVEADVLKVASEENKAIVLAFYGTDCLWSQKMVSEILNQEAFAASMRDKAVLWGYPLQPEGNQNEEKMRKRFKVEECPMILLLDPQGKEFARVGYVPIGAKEFADKLVGLIADFRHICLALRENAPQNWEELFYKSKQFSSAEFKKLVLERAIKEVASPELLMEKYIFLLEERKLKDNSVQECRKKLLELDPHNCLGMHFKMALADFHKLSTSKKSTQRVLRPLMRYLEHFGNKDSENAWKVEMVIAKYFFTKQMKEQGVAYAKKAYAHAPEGMKESIGLTIAKYN